MRLAFVSACGLPGASFLVLLFAKFRCSLERMKKSTKISWAVSLLVLLALILFGVQRWAASRDSSSEEMLGVLLHDMPGDTSGIVYVDVTQLRRSPFAQKLFAWAPKPQADPEYTRFVAQTGFNYEHDLDRVAFSAATRGSQPVWFAIADGTFDQKKIAAYMADIGVVQKRGGHDIYSIPASLPTNVPGNALANGTAPSASPQISFTFLRPGRIAATNDADLSVYLNQKKPIADPVQWQTRFIRLAGSPLFIVVRQNASTANSLAAQAPGGFQSPQLSALLGELTWLTFAAQPQDDSLRIVAEGESPSDTSARQLADMLDGAVILAQAGLNDPKMRQQLNPEARTAYLELLKSADITRLDREELKAVRVVFEITANFLKAATLPKPTPAAPQPASNSNAAAKPAHTGHK